MARGETIFAEARKLGLREYSRSISKGQSGYLPFLEGVLKNIEIVSEVDLGIIEIPLKKVVGTYSYSRSRSFAPNFMPILGQRTEFGQKWIALCEAHLNEGIRDPIKVYEYLNWFYVVEGNKRVSVLKHFNAYSIPGRVSRLIPKWDENEPDIVQYYEFLEFYKKTGINTLWFTRKNGFATMFGYLEKFQPSNPKLASNNKYKYFAQSVYFPFRKVYLELGGQRLPITTGDAFLEYVKVYGLPEDVDEPVLKSRLGLFISELEQFSGTRQVLVQTEPVASGENLLSTITTLVRPKKKLNVAFVYAKDVQHSSWTYAQEMGRGHVERVLKEHIQTRSIDHVPENGGAYEYLKKLAEEGSDVVFATSPAFINATLKAALEYPETRFLNCSETHSFKHVNTYFGRIYETRFLAGVVAGAVTQSDILGYVGTHPIPGVINGINSFALGARLSNPHVKVKVAWTHQWDDLEKSRTASLQLIQEGADIISHHDTLSNREFSKEYGVYSVLCSIDAKTCEPGEYIAAPVWNWGIFYERILRNLLNNSFKGITDIFGAGQKVVNFWWGMDSGIVDFFYSKRLVPRETQKLVELLKQAIVMGTFHPFTGPVYSQDGTLQVKPDQIATRDQIIGMNWFVDVVE